jgi:anti-sigma factor RsiW
MICHSRLISPLLDDELGVDQHSKVSDHLERCPFCQKELREIQELSARFKVGLDESVSQVNAIDLEERILEAIQAKRVSWLTRLKELIASKRVLVPAAASIAVLLMFCLNSLKEPTTESEPSAIIDSFFGTRISYILILQTPASNQTILWVKEEIHF